MKSLGHDLVELHEAICQRYYGGLNRPFIQEELTYLENDQTLKECVRILSIFGKFGRYYNLDVVAGSPHPPIDPKSEWESLERSVEDASQFLHNSEALYRDYYPRVHAKLISKLERLVRAIALQFTIGDHQDKLHNLRSTSVVYTDFRLLKNEELGTIDYRQSVRILKQEQKNWIKRTEEEIINSRWPKRIITHTEFTEEWPFRINRAIIELQESFFAIIYIEGYAFALNGAASGRFNFPNPHDAGMAILGKSVGPFIDLALSLKNSP